RKLNSARAKSRVGPASSRVASAQRRRFRLKDLSRRLYRRGRLPEDNLWAACPSEGRAGSKNFEPTRFSGKRPSATSRRSDDVIFLICLKPSRLGRWSGGGQCPAFLHRPFGRIGESTSWAPGGCHRLRHCLPLVCPSLFPQPP